MKHILFAAIGVVCLTALIGAFLSTTGFNYITDCFGGESHLSMLLFASFGGAGLAYTVWSNRKNMSAHGKPTKLAVVTLLFMPTLALFFQIAIPAISVFHIDNGWANLALYALILFFFLNIGNYVTTTRRDGFGGIRNGWTLSSRIIWANTQRLHGHLLVFGSLATLFLIPVSSVGLGMLALMFVYLFSTCIATVYSAYRFYSLEPAL